MAKCLADSLIYNSYKFNPIDLRIRFQLWWNYGYNNNRNSLQSFGLGGNINKSFQQFNQKMSAYTIENEDQYFKGQDNGNGSIMRIAPIPIAFHQDINKAEQIAKLQSQTTHNGYEAGEASRLLTHLIIRLINYQGQDPQSDIFDTLGTTFQTNNFSVRMLSQSKAETYLQHKYYPQNCNYQIEDRFWDWKQKKLQISPTRILQNQDYYGSYVMDCLYIALHISYHSQNIEGAILKAINLGGDSDTIASVVGCICGAMYGLQKEILELYLQKMVLYDKYQIIVTAYKLFFNLKFK